LHFSAGNAKVVAMPRVVDPDARRDAIARAVVQIASRDGFAVVTVRSVAAELGASTSAVTHYVSGRDEMVRGAVAREMTARLDAVEAALEARTGVAGIRALVDWLAQGTSEKTRRFWLAVLVNAPRDPVLRDELDAFNARWDSMLTRLVGGLEPRPRAPQRVVDAIDVAIDGLVVSSLEEATPWTPARRRAVLDILLSPLLSSNEQAEPEPRTGPVTAAVREIAT
jgi:AcrR family transcriptional regulator